MQDTYDKLKEEGIDLRDKLVDFYSRWYSSNLMYMAVQGKGNFLKAYVGL